MKPAYPNRLSVGITTVSFGGFVIGCIYKQPELIVSGLAVSGVGFIKLLTGFVDYIDVRNEVTNEATQIVIDTQNG